MKDSVEITIFNLVFILWLQNIIVVGLQNGDILKCDMSPPNSRHSNLETQSHSEVHPPPLQPFPAPVTLSPYSVILPLYVCISCTTK